MNKIVIVGCGNVGMAYAYSLVMNGAGVDELVLIDINQDKAQGEAMDLNHALSYSGKNMKVFAGDYSDCGDATLVVLTAGRNQDVGETRNDLVHKNYEVFSSIISEINKTSFEGIYLVATNPVDIMSLITLKLSGFASNRVIGSGTTLDTARLRFLAGQELQISPNNIHGYVIGEHGDSELIPWDSVTVGLNPISSMLSSAQKNQIALDVKNSAYDIIEKKGSTSYGIGACLLKITKAILQNENTIMSVSCYDGKYDICYSMPAIINRQGIRECIDLKLTKADSESLKNSIKILQNVKNELL
ncbi:MAG: L-lactate dehydrogenase [Clostridia bacterium]|nr:L-lactate dehydrogenase [Clostridia bacterium]